RELADPANGIHLEGWTEDAALALSRCRVNLAPLRFGAGIKGKVLEGWRAGTPVVATPIAAEGLSFAPESGGGSIAGTAKELARAAVELHQDPKRWNEASAAALKLYSGTHWDPEFAARTVRSLEKLLEE